MLRTVLLLHCFALTAVTAPLRAFVGGASKVPDNPRSHYSRYVNWRPADGEIVHLNPPRLSWPYWPDWPGNWQDAHHRFQLQISSRPDCASPVVDVTTAFNFYNTIPALTGGDRWHWRVGYDVGETRERWSPVRSFIIADDAVTWDRSQLATPDLPADHHPRILFGNRNWAEARRLADINPASRAALDRMIKQADGVLRKSWWDDFPATDREDVPKQAFFRIAEDLATVCFVWRITEDDRYAGVKERAVTWASYPRRGRSSPEGLGGDGSEDATQGNEFLALLFDWLYADLSAEERRTMIASLEWRVDHIMNRFSWRAFTGGAGAMLRLTFKDKEAKNWVKPDQRLKLDRSSEWREFQWVVDVPPGAENVVAELFNYYAQGTVIWDELRIQPRPEGPNLVQNSTFNEARKGLPRGWQAYRFGTTAETRFDLTGGQGGTGAMVIVCDDSTERGSWGQRIHLKGATALDVFGRYRTKGTGAAAPVRARSLSGMCSSHQFESSMDTAACGLALYGHSAVGQEWFELILNYMIGVTNGFGFDEAWNEGAGYGSSKFKWLMNATMYYDMALPQAQLGRNPYYSRLGDWLSRIIPVGMDHHAWGNQRNASPGNHLSTFRKLAHLTGEGRFLLNWQQYGGQSSSKWRPWIEYMLPLHYTEPKPVPEDRMSALFSAAGWVMAATGPPSLKETYADGLGFIFQCRPRGGYSHSFNSDASFQLHAYGQMLNHGGGSSGNRDAYAYHAMSHNTILVDGLGQAQPSHGMSVPSYGRIVGYARGPGYVYTAGDATHCYPRSPGNYSRWGLPMGKVYEERALLHLKRFVRHILFLEDTGFLVYDDVASTEPATYTWLYHIRPQQPFAFESELFRCDYAVGTVKARLQHISRPGELRL
ncbi:MAG: DUF4962 domain-containing protein, partial [Lentisphaerae bacterium]|nr:DUF4962 domain-containing protein [Lentisphaerota bacterium]